MSHWRVSSCVQRCEGSPERGYHSAPFGTRARFSVACRIDNPRWRQAVFEHGTDMPTRRMDPPPAASSPMRMTASWSGSNDPTAYKSVARDPRPMASSPSDYQSDMQCAASDAPTSKSPISLVILPLRAQASRRCETQAPLSGKPPSYVSVSVPGPLPRAPGTRSQATGRRTAFRSEQRTGHKPKGTLDTKSPIQVRIHLPPAVSQQTFGSS